MYDQEIYTEPEKKMDNTVSYDAGSGSEITSCIKIETFG